MLIDFSELGRTKKNQMCFFFKLNISMFVSKFVAKLATKFVTNGGVTICSIVSIWQDFHRPLPQMHAKVPKCWSVIFMTQPTAISSLKVSFFKISFFEMKISFDHIPCTAHLDRNRWNRR